MMNMVEVREWFNNAVNNKRIIVDDCGKVKYMIVMFDIFDADYYPVYVTVGEDLNERCCRLRNQRMQQIERIYDLDIGFDNQNGDWKQFYSGF